MEDVRRAALDSSYVSLGSRRTSSVHEFYRYPARFSPGFAAAVIKAFTSPGELVLDPFVGGGTTMVESRLLGRPAIGSDLNPLAIFVATAKTTPYSRAALARLDEWTAELPKHLRMHLWVETEPFWEENGYLRHLAAPDTWRLRRTVALALHRLIWLDSAPARLLARCAILRTAQWALDMRDEIPSVSEFRDQLLDTLGGMSAVARDHTEAVRLADDASPQQQGPKTKLIESPLPGLASNRALREQNAPRLVLTSPPYPGVYVNYHRWKIRGRLETPAPYWIADCLDGNGIAHYTMGARSEPTLNTYFARLEAAFSDLARIAAAGTWLVQMVGFNNPKTQLPRYLRAMERCGFAEHQLADMATEDDGRLWRPVPSRRWWTQAHAMREVAPHTSREVVLVHRRVKG